MSLSSHDDDFSRLELHRMWCRRSDCCLGRAVKPFTDSTSPHDPDQKNRIGAVDGHGLGGEALEPSNRQGPEYKRAEQYSRGWRKSEFFFNCCGRWQILCIHNVANPSLGEKSWPTSLEKLWRRCLLRIGGISRIRWQNRSHCRSLH